jgi:hypothetical protein
MATIVTMPAQRPKRFRSDEAQAGARILFFTGIRYVRDDPSEEEDETDTTTMLHDADQDLDLGALALI